MVWGGGGGVFIKSRALPVHTLFPSFLVLLFRDPHLLEGSLEERFSVSTDVKFTLNRNYTTINNKYLFVIPLGILSHSIFWYLY